MAQLELSASPALHNDSPKTRGVLLETMQIVEPRKQLAVANHLLESSKTVAEFYLPSDLSMNLDPDQDGDQICMDQDRT